MDTSATFSWGLVPDTEHYDIIAYRLPKWMLPENLDLTLAQEVLLARIPGNATSWTPDMNRCLSPGETYIWFARAVFGVEKNVLVFETPIRRCYGQLAQWIENHGRLLQIHPAVQQHQAEQQQ